MQTTFKTKGTCSTQIVLDIEDGIIQGASFTSGCNGNLQGIAALVTGMDARTAADKLRGIRCGFRSTSCPDQLSKAIEQALSAE